MNEEVKRLAAAVNAAKEICVFTGAGISCPSGIPDFRSADGLYNSEGMGRYTPEEIISHSFFVAHPDLFYEFYKSKMMYPDAKPNDAHLVWAELERAGKRVSVVTQNIDGLHTDAGSTEIYELHGSVRRNHCTHCRAFYDGDFVYRADGVPRCPKCGGLIKPDVVLYEEGLDGDVITGAVNAIGRAELMVVIGTSLAVYPAASFLGAFAGSTVALINLSSTPYDRRADIVLHEDAAAVARDLREACIFPA
ncbi:MAG: NAD-dependent protein deacylase [Clostridia bacterium]|nr:NAD-dependent protein deacylase [Clostridia bacterium]